MMNSESFDDGDGFNARKRFRRSRDANDIETERVDETVVDPRLFELSFPKEYEPNFVSAVFELGLKHSSPKLIMPLMTSDNGSLSTEHIKSHLQKYRIHHQRSKEEFLEFYEAYIKDAFMIWENNRGWEIPSRQSTPRRARSNSCSSNQSNATNSSVTDRYKFANRSIPTLSSSTQLLSGNSSATFPHMRAPSRSSSNDRAMHQPSLVAPMSFMAPISLPPPPSGPSTADLLLRSETLLSEWRNSYQDTLQQRERMMYGNNNNNNNNNSGGNGVNSSGAPI